MKGSKGEKGEGTGLLFLLPSLAFWHQSHLRSNIPSCAHWLTHSMATDTEGSML